MRRLSIPSLTLAGLLLLGSYASGQTFVIGGLDQTRVLVPLSTSGGVGYDRLRGHLLNPANFGPGGTVPFEIELAPENPSLDASYLANKDALYLGV